MYKLNPIQLFIVIFSSMTLLSVHAQTTDPKVYPIEDFEDGEVGKLPAEWYNQKGDNRPITYTGDLLRTYNYQILSDEENQFLRFEGRRGKHLNYPLAKKEDLNIYDTPILNWKWRIFDIPEGANEDNDDRNDVAASIYVVFDLGRVLFKKVPKSIRYTWSSTLPVGTELSKFYGNQKIVVVGSGEGEQQWKNFRRNIVEDYKRLFGDPPPEVPLAILILSDGNNTKDPVKADYDEIFLSSQ